MFALLVALYRANPFRPHCNSRAGLHVLPCKLYTAFGGPKLGPECDFPAPPN